MIGDDFGPQTARAFAPLVLFAAIAAGGCTTDRPSAAAGDLTTTIDTVDGVVRIVNSGAPPQWQLTLQTSIGPRSLAVGDGGPEEFGRVTTAVLGPGGEVYVGDSQYLEIRVFGLDGDRRPPEAKHVGSQRRHDGERVAQVVQLAVRMQGEPVVQNRSRQRRRPRTFSFNCAENPHSAIVSID